MIMFERILYVRVLVCTYKDFLSKYTYYMYYYIWLSSSTKKNDHFIASVSENTQYTFNQIPLEKVTFWSAVYVCFW